MKVRDDKNIMVGNPFNEALKSDNLMKLKPKSGGNKLIWDMRYPGFTSFDGMVLYSSPNLGPKVAPGEYILKMSYNDIQMSKKFEILKDPRVKTTQEGFEAQLDFLLKVRDEVSRANQSIINIREIKKDMNFIASKSNVDDQLKDLINNYLSDLSEVENIIHMTKNQSRQDPLNFGIRINNRIAFLLADSQRGDYPPTNQAIEFFNEVKKELDSAIINLDEVIKNHSTRINNYVKEKNIELISFNN